MAKNRHSTRAIVSLLGLVLFAATTVSSQTQKKVIGWSKSPIGSHVEPTAANLQLFPQIDGVEIEDIAEFSGCVKTANPKNACPHSAP
jgi:hypothetical protein